MNVRVLNIFIEMSLMMNLMNLGERRKNLETKSNLLVKKRMTPCESLL